MSEYITVENAENFIGKVVDCKRRLLHYYPLKIGKNSEGKYNYTSIEHHVTMPLNEGERIAYDYILN